MKLETFFEKFDQFADAPDAVAKMRELVLHGSANGAPHTSLGQRPRKTVPRSSRALKGRANVPALGGCLRRRCGRSARSPLLPWGGQVGTRFWVSASSRGWVDVQCVR